MEFESYQYNFRCVFIEFGGHFESEKSVQVGFLSFLLNAHIFFDDQSSSLSFLRPIKIPFTLFKEHDPSSTDISVLGIERVK